MDIQVEIQNYLTRVEQEEEKLLERDMKIAQLEAELQAAKDEYNNTLEEFNSRDIEIANLE